jgi:hypothetical protein
MNINLTLKQLREKSSGFHSHARKCKKDHQECKVCGLSIEFHKQLPLLTLSQVLSE